MKRLGCCTLCEKPVYEITQTYTREPIKGWARRLGAPTADHRTVDYILSDGSHAAMSFCADCEERAKDPANFPEIWRLALEAYMHELDPKILHAKNIPPRTAQGAAAAATFVDRMSDSCIVGVHG